MLVGVPKEVLVTGAGGRTGFLAFTKLREMEKDFYVKGFVHDKSSAVKLERTGASLGDSAAIMAANAKLRKIGMPAEDDEPEVFIGDIRKAEDLRKAMKNCDALVILTSGVPKLRKREIGRGKDEELRVDRKAMENCDALVILTSGVPKLRKREIFKTVLCKPENCGLLVILTSGVPKLRKREIFKTVLSKIDWIGCKQQIDVAKELGVEHIVLVSSMGVSERKNNDDNMLNKIGNGNILVWKAKAEAYLMGVGVPYTIIHPGGLSNKPGGEREIVVGVNDDLLDNFAELGASRSIPRADVAEVVAQGVSRSIPRVDVADVVVLFLMSEVPL
ncbi:hypothetical protein T484DRAFT_1776731 [Baffinella frigidus]|nr:hypothetical protein T484DRAFT_1776731 [Cryptophyta sp. CCMP2293]